MTKKATIWIGAAVMAFALAAGACSKKDKGAAGPDKAAMEHKGAMGGGKYGNPCGAANPCGAPANPCGGAANPCGGK